MVAGVLGLHDFHPKAPRKQFVPNFTDTDGSHYLVPDDFAAIYNLAPLYDYGYTGAGQSIVIVGQSNIDDPRYRHVPHQFGHTRSQPTTDSRWQLSGDSRTMR